MGELSGEQSEQLIEDVAQRLGRWKLTLPAILFLEVFRPLSFLASQGLLVCQPVLGFFYPESQVAEYAHLMADRANVDRLLARLEQAGPGHDKYGKERG